MNYSGSKPLFIFAFLTLFFYENSCIYGQSTVVKQDPKFEQLLKEKRKINSGIVSNNLYKIQVFNGNMEQSKKALLDFKKEFKDLDATLVFNTPFYKVWAGNFKTRIEVERHLIAIKKKYPNAFVIKPNQ
jgi:SPOR domain